MELAKRLIDALWPMAQGRWENADDIPTPALLQWRLTSLRVNPKRIELTHPCIFGNLKQTCWACPVKQRCIDDMQECLNPPGWESYCPNAGTIRTLM